jgi:Anti-sigma-28 factor, FlgM
MSETRSQHITSLKERIERGEYDVDVHAVAEALLSHPTGRMLMLRGNAPVGAQDVSAEDNAEPAVSSGDVLEAA